MLKDCFQVIYVHLLLALLAILRECGLCAYLHVTSITDDKDDEDRSLNEVKAALMVELLAIACMGVPVFGGIGLGYLDYVWAM